MHAKRLECVELAPAFPPSTESAGKPDALQTLRVAAHARCGGAVICVHLWLHWVVTL